MSAIGHTSDPEGARLAVEAMLAAPDLDCPMCRPDLHVECWTPGHRLCQPHLNTERGRARAPLDGQTFHLRQDTADLADAPEPIDPDGMYLVTWPERTPAEQAVYGGAPSKRLLFGHRLLVHPVGRGATVQRLEVAQ